MRKSLITLVLSLLLVGGVFAQDTKQAKTSKKPAKMDKKMDHSKMKGMDHSKMKMKKDS